MVLLAPHILLAANPHGTALGGPLGAIGAIGMLALALWAILPRWQSVVPGPLRGLVVAARDAPGVHEARRIFGGYERWRALHRTTGLFVAAGFAHGVLDGTPFDGAPILRWSYVAIGAVGLGFYVYRELLARFFLSLHDYQVQTVREVDEGVVEIAMADGEAPFAAEIRAIADRHGSLHAHLIDTGVEGRLTSERVLAAADGDRRELSVFMCGPRGMLRTFQTELRVAGVPSRRIHREHFDWR